MSLSGLRKSIAKRIARARLPGVARRVLNERLTYLSLDRMHSLLRELSRVNRDGIEGDFAEFGIALGGSSIVIASHRGKRKFAGYDVFGRIPEPTSNDGADAHKRFEVIKSGQSKGLSGRPYYGYQGDLYEQVSNSFGAFGMAVDQRDISLHKGLFEETYSPKPDQKYALIHIDCDWYDPVYFCLTQSSPFLSPGGVILVDDYNDYDGCRKAVDFVLGEDGTLILDRTLPHAVLRKKTDADR